MILFPGLVYDQNSIDLMKRFIVDCKKLLGDNPFLWMAFQNNSLSDNCCSSSSFKSQFQNMIEILEDDLDFFFPKLFMNMRNSREVTQVARTVKTDLNISRITSVVDFQNIWKSSICSYIPTLIPISKENLDQNYSKLFEMATEKGKLNIILFNEGGSFDLEEIKQAILDCGVDDEKIFVLLFFLRS